MCVCMYVCTCIRLKKKLPSNRYVVCLCVYMCIHVCEYADDFEAADRLKKKPLSDRYVAMHVRVYTYT